MKILNRAMSLYSNEYFISESVKFEFNQMYLFVKGKWRECDESTRSINLSDMLDSEGTKIFASLSEDGKGGDNIHVKDFEVGNQNYKCVVRDGCSVLTSVDDNKGFYTFDLFDCDLKITGIQK